MISKLSQEFLTWILEENNNDISKSYRLDNNKIPAEFRGNLWGIIDEVESNRIVKNVIKYGRRSEQKCRFNFLPIALDYANDEINLESSRKNGQNITIINHQENKKTEFSGPIYDSNVSTEDNTRQKIISERKIEISGKGGWFKNHIVEVIGIILASIFAIITIIIGIISLEKNKDADELKFTEEISASTTPYLNQTISPTQTVNTDIEASTHTVSPTLPNPDELYEDEIVLAIQSKVDVYSMDTVIILIGYDEKYYNYGYLKSFDGEITITGLDENFKEIWTQEIDNDYFVSGIYSFYKYNDNIRISLKSDKIDNIVTYKNNEIEDFVFHLYTIADFIEVSWTGSSIDECNSIINIEYENMNGYEELLITPDFSLQYKKMLVLPGKYKLTFYKEKEDVFEYRIIDLFETGTYDFSYQD